MWYVEVLKEARTQYQFKRKRFGLGGFGDKAGAKASRARPNASYRAFKDSSDTLKIGIGTSFTLVIGVTNAISC